MIYIYINLFIFFKGFLDIIVYQYIYIENSFIFLEGFSRYIDIDNSKDLHIF